MTFVYFIRHAQAGSRDNYDVLSELGQEQARLLGEHLVAQGVELSAIYSGEMRRQRHTAELACAAFSRAGLSAPDITVDERWNEFSLASIYRAISRRMVEEDSEFARDFQDMQEMIRRDPHTTGGAVGRCDAAVIRAWIDNRFPDFAGESWAGFRGRVESCTSDLCRQEKESAIAVFTSATPVAILSAAALSLTEEKLLSILGVIYNASVTVMRARNNELRMFTFNSTAHLPVSHRTFR